jgi:sporulation protein YlmC with PRC-barrel domain
MQHRSLLSVVLASVALAACAAPPPAYAPPPAAISAGPINLAAGVWDNQQLTPPAGLVAVTQSAYLVGDTVTDSNGIVVGQVTQLLVDPTTSQSWYAVVASPQFPDYLAVPVAALHNAPPGVALDVPAQALIAVPRLAIADFSVRYPATLLSSPLIMPPLTTLQGAMTPGPVTVLASPSPAEPLELVSHGSVVGFPVTDNSGRAVGIVNRLAIIPSSGEVRYLIVSSADFGSGNFIAVPAVSANTINGQVILAAPYATWAGAQRYQETQLRATYGSLGSF